MSKKMEENTDHLIPTSVEISRKCSDYNAPSCFCGNKKVHFRLLKILQVIVCTAINLLQKGYSNLFLEREL